MTSLCLVVIAGMGDDGVCEWVGGLGVDVGDIAGVRW